MKTKSKNEKKEKKNKNWIIIVLLLLLIILLIFLLLKKGSGYTLKFNTDGGSQIESIKVTDGEIVYMPAPPQKTGYRFAGWINENDEIITSGIKLDKNTTIKALWIANDKKIHTISFVTDNEEEYNDVIIENDTTIKLPTQPKKDGYIFIGWINNKGKLVNGDFIVTANTTLSAKWISENVDTVSINFDTDGGTNIGKVLIENGKIIVFPTTPTKDGFVFAGWVDENGNAINKNTKVNNNITLKATWQDLYTCPKNCEVNKDKKTCNRTITANLNTADGCPYGTETIEKFCSSHQYQTSTGGDDPVILEAGISCEGNPKGFCVDYKNRKTINSDTCSSGYFRYYDSDGLGVTYGCVKKYEKLANGCPAGYTKNGNTCMKKETVNCTKNTAKEY